MAVSGRGFQAWRRRYGVRAGVRFDLERVVFLEAENLRIAGDRCTNIIRQHALEVERIDERNRCR